MSTAGIVLCGGKSSRMRRAKAWLPWRGRPMVAHVVETLRRVVDEVIVVSSDALELPRLAARVVLDREPDRGPLAGIREGLASSQADLAFVCGTDSPFLSGAFVETMLSHGCASAAEIDGHIQTLAAVYPRAGLCHAETLLGAGRARPLDLLEAMDYRKLAVSELPDVESVRGFNTPSEYLEAVRELAPDASATIEFFGRSRLAAGLKERSVPVGTLGEVLAHAPESLELVKGERVSRHYLISLDGRTFVQDPAVPIGPGEHVIVLDVAAGG